MNIWLAHEAKIWLHSLDLEIFWSHGWPGQNIAITAFKVQSDYSEK